MFFAFHRQNAGIDLKSFWKQSADFYLREGDPQAAVMCLQHLLALDPNDQKTIAKLVIAYVNVSDPRVFVFISLLTAIRCIVPSISNARAFQFDRKKAAEYCDRLPPINIDDGDISALESVTWQSSKQKKSKVLPSPGYT